MLGQHRRWLVNIAPTMGDISDDNNIVEHVMTSHSYEQPTSYGWPLGHSPKWHFLYELTFYEHPPAFKGHFSSVTRVAAHSRVYCTLI